MNHLPWKKVALGITVILGSCASLVLPANAISIGFDNNTFSQLDGDNNEDAVVKPNSTFSVDIVLDTTGLESRIIESIQYEINSANDELTFATSDLDRSDLFQNSNIVQSDSSDNIIEIQHTSGSIQESDAKTGVVLDTITYNTGSTLPNDGFNDLNFASISISDSEDVGINSNLVNVGNEGTAVDLEGEVQAVPFEAKTGMGFLALAGLFGVRKFRQLRAKRQVDASS
jgi:hypothetical protein